MDNYNRKFIASTITIIIMIIVSIILELSLLLFIFVFILLVNVFLAVIIYDQKNERDKALIGKGILTGAIICIVKIYYCNGKIYLLLPYRKIVLGLSNLEFKGNLFGFPEFKIKSNEIILYLRPTRLHISNKAAKKIIDLQKNNNQF